MGVLHANMFGHNYASGFGSYPSFTDISNCPCKQNSVAVVPPFVGIDYYCDSGQFYCCYYSPETFENALWDGPQCNDDAPPNTPWFIKTLNETTTENIELRICDVAVFHYGQVLLELIELFVR